jgi:hypothetical protein
MARKPRVESADPIEVGGMIGWRAEDYWCMSREAGATAETGKRLRRDPSMISRLYEGNPDREREGKLSGLLSRRVQTQA